MSENVYEFGQRLLDAGDLDPVYTVVWGASLPLPELERWLLAYWCFYDVGTATWICDVKTEADYWRRMWDATCSPAYPRGRERRHFRAANADKSMTFLSEQQMDGVFEGLRPHALAGHTMRAGYVMETVQEWAGFGPWIAFKAADMLDRCGYCPVEFDVASAFFYDSPKKAAKLLWDMEGQPSAGFGDAACEWAVNRICSELSSDRAPPMNDRPLNCQEAETILCKWGASLTGHYHIGEDVAAVKKGIMRVSRSRLAQRMRRAGKEAGLWT